MVNRVRLAYFSREQLRALLTAARAESERDYLLLLVAYSHGLRASEAISLTPAHIRDGYLTVRRLKRSLPTTQPLVESDDPLFNEKAALSAWCEGKRKNERLFPIERRMFHYLVQKYGKAAGLPETLCHPHALKHSLAMHSIKSAGIENVKQYLGHKNGNSTLQYLRVSDLQASAAIAAALNEKKGGN